MKATSAAEWHKDSNYILDTRIRIICGMAFKVYFGTLFQSQTFYFQDHTAYVFNSFAIYALIITFIDWSINSYIGTCCVCVLFLHFSFRFSASLLSRIPPAYTSVTNLLTPLTRSECVVGTNIKKTFSRTPSKTNRHLSCSLLGRATQPWYSAINDLLHFRYCWYCSCTHSPALPWIQRIQTLRNCSARQQSRPNVRIASTQTSTLNT